MMQFRSLIFTFLLILVAASLVGAGIDDDLYSEIVFLRGIELGAGGRALALGGAYRSLSDDLSALYWNPAGLATVRRLDLTVGISQAQTLDEARKTEEIVSNQLSTTRLNELGLVFPIPTYRGSLVFAVGYHQVLGFDSFGTFEESTNTSDFIADEWETGRLGLYSFGMGIDISPTISTGLALRIWSGYDDYQYDQYTSGDDYEDEYNQTIDLGLSGFNALMGLMFRPNNWLRIGATLESPLKIKISEDYLQKEEGITSGNPYYEVFSGKYEYSQRRPFRFGVGGSALIGPVILTSDMVLNNWSQIAHVDEPPYLELSKSEANRNITKNLKTTVDFHLGTEIWIPQTPVRMQLGYAWLPSPFKNDDIQTDKHIFNGGISTLLDQSLLLQTTLSWTGWERSLGGWGEDLQLTHLLLTISYRF